MLIKISSIFALIAFLAVQCCGQEPTSRPLNSVKIDVSGLAKCLSELPEPETYTLSLEYERKFNRPLGLSLTGDLEFRSQYYQFFRVFEWPRPNPILSKPSVGWTVQQNWTVLAGVRWSFRLMEREKFFVSAGIEPRIGLQYAHAFLTPFDVFAPSEDLSKLSASPRLRGVISALADDRIGIEFLGEFFRYHQLGNDRNRFLVTPEINVFVAF